MTDINIGDVVLCRQTNGVVWVVKAKGPDGFWHLRSKARSGEGASYYGRLTGDVTVVTPRPTYAIGTVIPHQGLDCTVAADLGDEVVLDTPAKVRQSRGGEGVKLPAGNVTVGKWEIVLNSL